MSLNYPDDVSAADFEYAWRDLGTVEDLGDEPYPALAEDSPTSRAILILEEAIAAVIAEDELAPWKPQQEGQPLLPLPILQEARRYLVTRRFLEHAPIPEDAPIPEAPEYDWADAQWEDSMNNLEADAFSREMWGGK